MLITHLQLAPRLRMSGAIPPLSLCLHGVDRDNFICMHENITRYAVDIPAAVLRLGSNSLIGCPQWQSTTYTVYLCVLQDSIILTRKCRNIDLSGWKRWRWPVTVHHDQRIWLGSSLSRSWKPLVSNPFDNMRRVYGRTSPCVVSFSSKGRFFS